MREILDYGKVSEFIPPKNSKKITLAIIKLLSNDEYRMQLGIAARERDLSHYNAEVICELQIDSYKLAIEEKNKKIRLMKGIKNKYE